MARPPTEHEKAILAKEKELEAARRRRDKAVNNKRTTPGSNKPSPKRSRKDILDELT